MAEEDERLIKEHCTQMVQDYSDRDAMDNSVEEAVMMEELAEAKPKSIGEEEIKVTTSPMAYNMALGAINLMTASVPTFRMPSDKNNAKAKKVSSKMEQVAQAVWALNSMLQQVPLENDLVTSGILFGEICGGVTSTKDMYEAGKTGPKASVKRLEMIMETTPYFFEIWDPRNCYTEEDSLGLSAFHRRTTMKSGVVLDKYGKEAQAILGDKRYEDVTLMEYWDNVSKMIWIDGKDGVIALGEHNLPVIPIVSQSVNGSKVYSKTKYRRRPFLYGLIKSGILYRQSLALTVLYQNLFTIGAWPEFVFTAEDGESLERDTTAPGVIRIKPGQKFEQLKKEPIDAGMKLGLDLAMQLGEETTMFKQALGQPIGGSNASYSMVSLLNQAGRLPLVPQQRRGSMGVAKFAEIMFKLWKDGGGKAKVLSEQGSNLELSPKDIPDSFIIEATLEIDLPQDDRLNAQIATQVTSGERPLASIEWAREKLMHIGQSDEMDKDIQKEIINAAIANMTTQIEIQKVMAKLQPQMQQPNMPGAGQNSQQVPPGQAQTEQGIQIPMQGQEMQQNGSQGQGLPPGLANMNPEQLAAMMNQQGIPPERQQAILQRIQQMKQGQEQENMGPGAAGNGLPLSAPVGK